MQIEVCSKISATSKSDPLGKLLQFKDNFNRKVFKRNNVRIRHHVEEACKFLTSAMNDASLIEPALDHVKSAINLIEKDLEYVKNDKAVKLSSQENEINRIKNSKESRYAEVTQIDSSINHHLRGVTDRDYLTIKGRFKYKPILQALIPVKVILERLEENKPNSNSKDVSLKEPLIYARSRIKKLLDDKVV